MGAPRMGTQGEEGSPGGPHGGPQGGPHGGPSADAAADPVEAFLSEVAQLLLRGPHSAAAAAAAAKGVWDYDLGGLLSDFLRLTEEGLIEMENQTLQQFDAAPCLLLPEAPPALTREGPPGPQGPRAPDLVLLPAVLRGSAAAAAAATAAATAATAAAKGQRDHAEAAGPLEGPPGAPPVRTADAAAAAAAGEAAAAGTPAAAAAAAAADPDEDARATYNDLQGLRVTSLKVHRETGGLLVSSSDAAAYSALAQGGPSSRDKGGPLGVGGPRGLGGPHGVGGPPALLALPAAEQGAADTWEEYPDFFAAADEGPPAHQHIQGPPDALPAAAAAAPAAAPAAAAAAAAKGSAAGPPSPPPPEAPDSWVQELLREGKGGPLGGPLGGPFGGPLGGPPGGPQGVLFSSSSRHAAEVSAALGLPEGVQPADAGGAPGGPPPHRLAFLSFLYGAPLGAPLSAHAIGEFLGALSLSARVQLELLLTKHTITTSQSKVGGGPPGGLTASALQQLLQRSSGSSSTGGPGGPQGPPGPLGTEEAPRRRPRDFLMNLPSSCEQPKENRGPGGGPPCRAPPASILGAPLGDPLLHTPGGPLLVHRASTREGQEALLRGLWSLPQQQQQQQQQNQGGPPAGGGAPSGAPAGAPGYSTLPGYPPVRLPGAPHRRLLRKLFWPPLNQQQQQQQQQQQEPGGPPCRRGGPLGGPRGGPQQQQQQQQQQQRLQWLHRWQWADDLLLLRLRECLAARRQALKMQAR
ncbi:LOW QUALITY PROTEIN: uncharacterized protein EMH_0023230 [Eimeria mitis]|uniref:Uncharacterized protein n=1 Tax=Eimeria mitis TaxID=44415 RepID=U6KAL4_9EIME|nr:LOW QUALITY PROTEIN: uncharacterized protein EMH_0023230 [Eimeria mitis]CDJ34984.1 hypothetical protein, conserved [Eimeria mitis]